MALMVMNRLSIKSTSKAVVAASLILALLARLPFAEGFLLHDHSDRGVHSHAATPDDLRDGRLHEAWHRYHGNIQDDDGDDRNSESGGDDRSDFMFILVSDPANTTRIHSSSSAVIASIRHLASKARPRSMLSSGPTDSWRIAAAPWPLAPSLRPACALDALLLSSHALLL